VPGTIPSTSLCGINNSLSSSKPTTSASIRIPLGSGTQQALPIGSFSPTASIISPVTRVTRPDTCIGSTSGNSARQSFRYDCQRPNPVLATVAFIVIPSSLTHAPDWQPAAASGSTANCQSGCLSFQHDSFRAQPALPPAATRQTATRLPLPF